MTHAKKLTLLSILLFIFLFLISHFFRPGILDAPKAGVEMTKPPWLFWIFYPLESALGIVGILVGSAVYLSGLTDTKSATFRLTGMFGKYELGTFDINSDDFIQLLKIPSEVQPGSYRLNVEGGGKSAKVVITVN